MGSNRRPIKNILKNRYFSLDKGLELGAKSRKPELWGEKSIFYCPWMREHSLEIECEIKNFGGGGRANSSDS
jgi:hypothetical protein